MVLRAVGSIVITVMIVSALFGGMASGGESELIMGITLPAAQADFASVEAWYTSRPLEICTDVVGPTGMAGSSTNWVFDAGNYATAWSYGETCRIMIARNIGNVGYAISQDFFHEVMPIMPLPPSVMVQMVSPAGAWDGDSVPLTWADPGDPNIAGYLVYRSTDGSNWNLLPGSGATGYVAGNWWSLACQLDRATAWTPGLSYDDSTAVPGQTYYYSLRYVYASDGVTGIPTSEHHTPGFANPDGNIEPVYSAGSAPVICPAPIELELHKAGDDIQLNWAGGESPFEIWRSNSVNGTGFSLYDITAGVSYLDIGALTDGNNYSYIIRGQSEPTDSNMGFKIIRPLTSDSLGFNWIGLPYKTDLLTADDLMDDINQYGAGDVCTTVTKWNQDPMGYISRMDIGAIRVGPDFVLEPGVGYQVDVNQPVDWIIVGAANDIDTPVHINLANNSLKFNWISLPYNTILTNADQAMDQINADTPSPGMNIDTFTRWDEDLQGYISRYDTGAIRVGPNFDIMPGYGYQVRMLNDNPAWEISDNVLYP